MKPRLQKLWSSDLSGNWIYWSPNLTCKRALSLWTVKFSHKEREARDLLSWSISSLRKNCRRFTTTRTNSLIFWSTKTWHKLRLTSITPCRHSFSTSACTNTKRRGYLSNSKTSLRSKSTSMTNSLIDFSTRTKFLSGSRIRLSILIQSKPYLSPILL